MELVPDFPVRNFPTVVRRRLLAPVAERLGIVKKLSGRIRRHRPFRRPIGKRQNFNPRRADGVDLSVVPDVLPYLGITAEHFAERRTVVQALPGEPERLGIVYEIGTDPEMGAETSLCAGHARRGQPCHHLLAFAEKRWIVRSERHSQNSVNLGIDGEFDRFCADDELYALRRRRLA